jgi:hypothetical protein
MFLRNRKQLVNSIFEAGSNGITNTKSLNYLHETKEQLAALRKKWLGYIFWSKKDVYS